MVGAPPPLHPCPPRAPPTCPILYNIAPQAVLDPEIAPSASCLGHAPSLRLRAADPCLALLGLCAGASGRRLWRHPAGRGLRAQGVLAALRRGSCGGTCGLGRALCSHWCRLGSRFGAVCLLQAADASLLLPPHRPVSCTPPTPPFFSIFCRGLLDPRLLHYASACFSSSPSSPTTMT